MPGRDSLLRIAINSNPDSMDEIVPFLLECGDVYRTYYSIDDEEDESFGLAELASDTINPEKYNKICWLLENGYKADIKELFCIAISFFRYTTKCKESGRYIPHLLHKRDQNKWLGEADEKFCSEFRRLSAYFPEDVFSYRDDKGKPKDWEETKHGNFRNTYPSNFWDDISVPYWSMPENTPHPTQKPEKLLAKLILASSSPGDVILDPFAGSGSTSVTAKKLHRRFVGIEQNEQYCIWAEKRLEMAESDRTIQGYDDGVFWERNTKSRSRKKKL